MYGYLPYLPALPGLGLPCGDPAVDLVFADTGGEHPETYDFIERHFRPWAESQGLTFHRVESPKAPTMYDYAFRRQMVPSINTRWCTDQFKVRLINAWLVAHGAHRKTPADVQIGISADESHRAVDGWPRRYAVKRWPLRDMQLTREDCRAIISSAGLPEPIKSGCYYCPLQSRVGWRRLQAEHPDLLDKALALEDNARARNPRDVLIGHGIALRDLFGTGGAQLPMAFDAMLENDKGCTSGHCFV